MKRNILITGFDNKLTENVARELADCLSLYYLSIPDLTLYYANRASKEVVLKEGGNKLYEKYVNIAVKDAVEFESMVAAADFTDLKLTHIKALEDTTLIVFLGESFTTLQKHGVKILKDVANHSRYKYKYGYDVYVNADAVRKKDLTEVILKEITSYYGG